MFIHQVSGNHCQVKLLGSNAFPLDRVRIMGFIFDSIDSCSIHVSSITIYGQFHEDRDKVVKKRSVL